MIKRYQLVKPIVSNKIYEASTLNKAASKCYKEVKLNQIAGASTFTMRNVDTNEITIWKIHHPYYPQNTKYQFQHGGDGEDKDDKDPSIKLPKDDEKLISLQNSIESLITRIGIIENKVLTLDCFKLMNEKKSSEHNDGTCAIM